MPDPNIIYKKKKKNFVKHFFNLVVEYIYPLR